MVSTPHEISPSSSTSLLKEQTGTLVCGSFSQQVGPMCQRSLGPISTVSGIPSFAQKGKTTAFNFRGHNSVEGLAYVIVEDLKAIWMRHVEFMMDLEKVFSKGQPNSLTPPLAHRDFLSMRLLVLCLLCRLLPWGSHLELCL